MIYLFTGTPGSSKTLNAIKFVCENGPFKDRPVYYYNIREVSLPWIELSEDEVKAWYDLPHGAVIVIDECQKIFRPRARSQGVPKMVEELETHRHGGFDIVLLTQGTSLVDNAVLAQVGKHHHLERRYGMERANWFTWEKACKSVDSQTYRKQAVRTTVPFDKKYFGVYKSAEVHTHKRQIPAKIMAAWAFIIGFVLVFGFYVKSIVSPDDPKPKKPENVVEEFEGPYIPRITEAPKEADWSDQQTPRLSGMPWTAPVYDQLMEPKSVPTPDACIHWKKKDQCVCSTRQGTRISIPKNVCLDIVAHGWFDRTKDYNGQRQQVASVHPNAVDYSKHSDQRKSRRILIAHSPFEAPPARDW